MGSDNKRSFSGRSDQRLKRSLSACLTVQQLRTTGVMVNRASHLDSPAPTNPAVCATLSRSNFKYDEANPHYATGPVTPVV
jgi:hypothetical protein